MELLRCEQSIRLEIVPGLSFCDLAWARLGIDPIEAGVRLVDAESFAVQAAGDAGPLLVGQCWSQAVLSSVKLCFDTDPGPAILLHHLGLADEVIVEVPWSEIDRTLEADHLTSLYVPHLEVPIAHELVRLAELVRVLRDRCPWDREQTHHSLVQHLLEETYEAMEAIELLGDDPAGAPAAVASHVSEELGDILCQVLFHAMLAEEEGLFNLADVARGVHDKLVAPPSACVRRRGGDHRWRRAGELGAQQTRRETAHASVRGNPRRHARTSEGRQGRAQAGGHGAGLDGDGARRPGSRGGVGGDAGAHRSGGKAPTRTRPRPSARFCWRRRGLSRTGARIPSCSFARRSTGWEQSWPWPRRPQEAPGLT